MNGVYQIHKSFARVFPKTSKTSRHFSKGKHFAKETLYSADDFVEFDIFVEINNLLKKHGLSHPSRSSVSLGYAPEEQYSDCEKPAVHSAFDSASSCEQCTIETAYFDDGCLRGFCQWVRRFFSMKPQAEDRANSELH